MPGSDGDRAGYDSGGDLMSKLQAGILGAGLVAIMAVVGIAEWTERERAGHRAEIAAVRARVDTLQKHKEDLRAHDAAMTAAANRLDREAGECRETVAKAAEIISYSCTGRRAWREICEIDAKY